ncbi:MAG TPA: flagellar biosynthesis protein FlhB [Gammaproteobacteria bacterium]|nr:flagellar biosynthesis protein FlhB [Gammaproteobacteria bacterium]
MAENQDGTEKTEEPTAKKIADAKKKGEVPRSRELNTTMVLLAGSLGLLMLGSKIGSDLADLIRSSLTIERQLMFEPLVMVKSAVGIISDAFSTLIPFMIILLASVFISPIVMGGFTFSFSKMKPKPSNMSPLKGIKKLFGTQGLMELVKSILKVILVGGTGAALIIASFDDVMRIAHYDFATAYVSASSLLGWFLLAVCSTVILIAVIDAPYQLWQHKKQLRMTKQEVKEERKNMEGNAEIKGKIRSLQMEAAMRHMMEEVPKADVVITNPTHFAVALKYDDGKMGAPRLVAKGAELVAARIREIAADNNVPLVEAPPLARAIFYTTELEDEIPARLYLAVAQVLAYVYQLRKATKRGYKKPEFPKDLDVPDEMWKGRGPDKKDNPAT